MLSFHLVLSAYHSSTLFSHLSHLPSVFLTLFVSQLIGVSSFVAEFVKRKLAEKNRKPGGKKKKGAAAAAAAAAAAGGGAAVAQPGVSAAAVGMVNAGACRAVCVWGRVRVGPCVRACVCVSVVQHNHSTTNTLTTTGHLPPLATYQLC
jgi:hypothetical protein